jgi:uncharacterized protein (DUF433 family)
MADNVNIVAAFDEDYAARLSGLSKSQLSYWYRSGFYVPVHVESGRAAFSRIYSFRDIVALKVLNTLRNQFKVSLQHLREVSGKLSHLAENKWTGVKLYAVKKGVVWIDPESEQPQEIVSGQFIVPIILDDVVLHTQKDLDRLAGRDEATVGRIERSRYINHNAPVVSGTRIRVSAIKAFSDAGYSTAQIVKEYPDLTEDDVRAALSYESEKAAA